MTHAYEFEFALAECGTTAIRPLSELSHLSEKKIDDDFCARFVRLKTLATDFANCLDTHAREEPAVAWAESRFSKLISIPLAFHCGFMLSSAFRLDRHAI